MLRKDSSDKELPYHRHDISPHRNNRANGTLMARLCECRTLVAICASILLVYCYSLYNEANGVLQMKSEEVQMYLLQADSYKAQVQVIYEHKQKLESGLAAAEALLTQMKSETNSEVQKLKEDLAAEQALHMETRRKLEVAQKKAQTDELNDKLQKAQDDNQALHSQVQKLQAERADGVRQTTPPEQTTTLTTIEHPAEHLPAQPLPEHIVEFVDQNQAQHDGSNVDETNYARRGGAVFVRDGQMPDANEERLERQHAAEEADREIKQHENEMHHQQA